MERTAQYAPLGYPSHFLSFTYYWYPLTRHWSHNPIGFLEVYRKPSSQDKYGKKCGHVIPALWHRYKRITLYHLVWHFPLLTL